LNAKLLSWGFPKIASPPASTPHVRCRIFVQPRMVAHPSARRCHPSRALRPCRSSRLRRFPPCGLLQVCCALQPAMRFAPFPTCDGAPLLSRDLSIPRRLRCSRSSPVASCMHTPFRAFPSSPAVPRHRGLVLPSRRFPTFRPARPQGFARATNPLSCTGVATSRDPMLSWAFIPFRVLPTRSARESHAMWLTRTRTRTRPTIAGASRACVDLTQPTWNRDSGSDTLRLSELDFSISFLRRATQSQRPPLGFPLAPVPARTRKQTRKPTLRRPF
jgi:hypothetical protein